MKRAGTRNMCVFLLGLNSVVKGEGHSKKRIFLSSPIKSLY